MVAIKERLSKALGRICFRIRFSREDCRTNEIVRTEYASRTTRDMTLHARSNPCLP
jgi:hypothetical protein